MTIDYGRHFFAELENGFEKADITGVVQFIFDNPKQEFYITVNSSSLVFTEGLFESPEAVVLMSEFAIKNIVKMATTYDPRVIEFSSSMNITGDKKLANFLCNLVMRPTQETLDELELAKKTTLENEKIINIPILHYPKSKDLVESIKKYEPLLMKGILDEWNVSQWSIESLLEKFGKYQVVSYLPWTIEDYIKNGASKYSGGTGLPGVLMSDFKNPKLLQDTAILGFPQLWLGSSKTPEKRSVTGLHFDCVHGVLCQIFGRKKILMYPPYEEKYLYPYRAFNQYRSCWTGPDVVDNENYPLFKSANPIEIILNPGDALYIPFGWYHCVYALDPVMSISYPLKSIKLE